MRCVAPAAVPRLPRRDPSLLNEGGAVCWREGGNHRYGVAASKEEEGRMGGAELGSREGGEDGGGRTAAEAETGTGETRTGEVIAGAEGIGGWMCWRWTRRL